MKKARKEKPNVKIVKPLTEEEHRLITGGDGGALLAFPFIQQAM